MNKFKTVEELKNYKEKHCGKDCHGDTCSLCIDRATEVLLKEYVAKYGCICDGPCHYCVNWSTCYKEDWEKINYFNKYHTL